MKKGKKLFFISLIVLMFGFVAGCSDGGGTDPGPGDDNGYDPYDPYDPNNNDSSVRLSFDLSGAKAVATTDSSKKGKSDVENDFGIELYKADAEDAFGLVKILENGDIEPAMEMEGGGWMPDIAFIATSPVERAEGKDIYVSFTSSIYNYSYDSYDMPMPGDYDSYEMPRSKAEEDYYEEPYFDEGGYDGSYDSYEVTETNLGSLFHIKPDGTYVAVMEGKDGSIRTQSWWGGAEDWKPVVFDANGNLYFCYDEYGMSNSLQVIYKYDPSTETVTPITPQLSEYQINAFDIDPTGTRLFVQGRYDDYSTFSYTFFSLYPLANLNRVKHVLYYEDTGDSYGNEPWIKGFKIAPDGDSLVLNGYNVRGVNGLLKVNIVSDSELNYEALYSDNSNYDGEWFDPTYNEWYSDWENKTYYNGLFDRFSTDGMYIMVSDGSEHYYVYLNEVANPTNGYVYVTNGDTLYLANRYQVEDPENYGNSKLLMTDGTNFYHGDRWSLQNEYTDNVLMTDGTNFFITGSWDLRYNYDGENYLLYYYSTDQVDYYYNGIIGENIFFANDMTNPGTYHSETDYNSLANPIYVQNVGMTDMSGNWVYKFLGLDVWYADDANDASLKSAELDYETIYDSAIKEYTISYMYQSDKMWAGEGILGRDIYIAQSTSDPALYDATADNYSEATNPQLMAEVQFYSYDPDAAYSYDVFSYAGYGTLGSDFDFATSESNPAAVSSYTSIQDMSANGETPLMKRGTDSWDNYGNWTYEVNDVDPDIAQKIVDQPNVASWYMWNEHWYADSDDDGDGDKASGKLDMEAIMGYIGSFYICDLELDYSDVTGDAAFATLLADEPYTAEQVVGKNVGEYGGGDNWFFLTSNFDKDGTDEPGTTFQEFKEANELGWLNFSDIGNLFYDDNGALWGVIGGSGGYYGSNTTTDPKPIKLLDSDGKRDLKVINAFLDDTYKPVGFTIKGNYLYFRNSLYDDGYPTGNHNLYRFDMTQEVPVIEDLLVNHVDNGWITILDFSVGPEYVYFTGISGTNIVGGKVNLETLEITPFDTAQRLANIEVY